MFVTTGSNAAGVLVLSTISLNRLPVTVSFGYDLNGNMLTDGQRVLEYDDGNRLTAVSVSNLNRTEFMYDGLGRRRIVREYTWSSGNGQLANKIGYICDGYLPIQERDANNNVLVTYTRGLDLSGTFGGAGGIGGLLARTDSSGSAFYHADAGGNITSLTDANGNAVARYLQDPFGKFAGKWGPIADVNAMGYSSMPKVEQSGLVGYSSRFYDPTLQRWLNPDPMGEFGGINRYGFNFNNPLSYIDPDGMAPQVVTASYNLKSGAMSVGYTDSQFGEDYGIGKHTPLEKPTLLVAQDMFNRAADLSYDRNASGLDAAQYYLMGLGLTILGTLEFVPDASALTKPAGKVVCKMGVEGTVDLYRAVGVREFNDVMANKAFQAGGNSMSARQFGLTLEEALTFADADPSKVAILKATVPESLLPKLDFSKTIDPFTTRAAG